MTRTIALLAASLFAATTASAGDEPSLADILVIPDSPMDTSTYLKADMSFADAMRMISTLTLPEPMRAEVRASPSMRVRTVMSEAAWEDKAARDALADASDGRTWRPNIR